MAYIQEKTKGKKIVSFKFKTCMGRDANGKQIFKCWTWHPPVDLAPATFYVANNTKGDIMNLFHKKEGTQMKKVISLLLALVMCLSLCACSGGNDEISLDEYKTIIDQQKQTISEYESTISNYKEQQEKYADIFGELENGNYDSAINMIQQLQEEAKRAEYESMGIEEITITIDNWDQYFEYTPNGEVYITNSFGEIDVFNFTGGIKLKDEYIMVENGGTSVSFEIVSDLEERSCTIDFESGSIEYGEVVSIAEERIDTYTTSFSDWVWAYGGNGVATFGQIHQAHRGEELIVTQKLAFCNITEMLRAEGTLYIYKN